MAPPFSSLWEWPWKRGGKGRAAQEEERAYRRLVSERVGRRHDGRPARTFHARWGSRTVANGGASRAGAGIDYVAREGQFHDRADLEHVAGDPGAMREALTAIDHSARIRRGPTAERVALTLHMELPADATAAQRRQVAEEMVATWRQRGHEALAAVHGNGEVQPHVHLLVTARPVERQADGTWRVDRDPARRPMRTKGELRANRQELAELVNRICAPEILFWGGRDAELAEPGIQGRAPRPRLPARVWYRGVGRREPDPEAIRRARERHELHRGAAWARARRREREREERLQRRGLVRQVTVDQARQEAQAARERAERVEAQVQTLSQKQRSMIADIHQDLGLPIPDLSTAEGQSQAWARVRQVLKERARAPQKAQERPERGAGGQIPPEASRAPQARQIGPVRYNPYYAEETKERIRAEVASLSDKELHQASRATHEELRRAMQRRDAQWIDTYRGGAKLLLEEAKRRGLQPRQEQQGKPRRRPARNRGQEPEL